ncbi:DoxX family protein [Marinomonas posidonica]|uniref:DoxX family protein n=1 Tax=Marinomonas posidonica (strain CECT 7376 / NCIMB 14433 / IVIA-Po-181) TaxID=491952 RepID=F6CUD4_MARPP|nr:DoxX family protein [Marinomonas posidonica]AEF55253.1 DoxX family protein [Marinomonas posidonica IVIA-Po-181]
MNKKVMNYLVYVSLALCTFAFGAAGAAKLAGVEQMHLSFALMGLPAWFGYFIGACELAGAIGIWFKKLRLYAASGLAIIMLGALYFHTVYETIANGIPAIILLLLLVHILVNRIKTRAA